MITRRGLDLIRSCDVLLHDRLVAPELVDEAPPDAERLFVGKAPGATEMPQAAIDALMVAKARDGKKVVRLKGGDPYVFGRGADEGQALAAAGIGFEVVPGVSAAVAAPAYAGIPVTHGGVASSFAVVTGHETSPRPDSADRLTSLARGADTLVLLMGAASLADTARRLIDAGRPGHEPVAFVERGTTPMQRTIVATLETAADVARAENIRAPVTIVVGAVVRLRDALRWFESRPLFGRRVVVTRPTQHAGPLVRRLSELGAEVLQIPTIEIVQPSDYGELDAAIDRLRGGAYSWVLFVSVNAVDHLFARLERGFDARALASTGVAAVGPVTAARLRSHGITPDLVPEEATAASAVVELGQGDGVLLMPRAADAPDDVTHDLQSAGWTVDRPIAYQTVRVTPGTVLREEPYDAITFASPSAVTGFVESVGEIERDPRYAVVCIGPSTAERARELGLVVDAVADPHTTQALVGAVVSALDARARGTMGR